MFVIFYIFYYIIYRDLQGYPKFDSLLSQKVIMMERLITDEIFIQATMNIIEPSEYFSLYRSVSLCLSI